MDRMIFLEMATSRWHPVTVTVPVTSLVMMPETTASALGQMVEVLLEAVPLGKTILKLKYSMKILNQTPLVML